MTESSKVREFDLNIEKVLDGWLTSHAIRELIANALDEQALTSTADIVVDKQRSSWVIRDFGRGLRHEHLTQNENDEKRAHQDKVVGRFGVGLKDALAVLHRHDVNVQIRSRHGDIALIEQSKANFADVVTLHAAISPPSDPSMIGTEVVLRGVSDTDVETARGYFLRFSGDKILESTKHGQILQRPAGRLARIYVNGLSVAEENNFLFSYNITSLTAPMRKALNRERTNVGRTAYSDRVKAMLLLAESQEVAELLTRDLQAFAEGTSHDESKWSDVQTRACQVMNSRGNVVFVSPEDFTQYRDMVEMAQREGKTIVTVPNMIAVSLNRLSDTAGAPVVTLSQFTKDWNESFTFAFVERAALDAGEQSVFDRTSQLVELAGGMPAMIKEVRISETMRFASGGDANGLWDVTLGLIVIHRPQLKSVRAFAGTLLHEVTHAASGHGDVSRDFELALTDLLGRVAEHAIATADSSSRG